MSWEQSQAPGQRSSPYEIHQDGATTARQEGASINPAPATWPVNSPSSFGAAHSTAPLVPNMLPLNSENPSSWPRLASYPYSSLPYANQFAPKHPHFDNGTAPFRTGVGMPNDSSPRTMTLPTCTMPWADPDRSPTSKFTAQSDLSVEQKRSRLPPETTARKVPRKADDGPMSSSSCATNVQSAKVKSKVITGRVVKSKIEHKKEISLPTTPHTKLFKRATPKPNKLAQRKRKDSTPSNRNAHPIPSSRHSRLVIDEDGEESDGLACTGRTRRFVNADDESAKSVQPTIETDDVVDEAAWLSQTPQAPAQQYIEPSSTIASLNHKPQGPYPRCKYVVPEGLKGVEMAMGPDNWNQYLVLLEKLWTTELHGEDFAAASNSMFRIFDDKLRKRMNSVILREMIKPELEKYMEEQRREGERSKEKEYKEVQGQGEGREKQI
ncbi:hypothetical protein J1614_010765 [Plenodomus biglobosus]|nr:hypothetical protein J1614_010765 [Plenodomus biglobosus]